MYLLDLVKLLKYIAEGISVQAGGLGFTYAPEGEYNAEAYDAYHKLYVEADPFFRYTGLPGNVTTETHLVFYILTRYRADETNKQLTIAEQQSTCETIGRHVLHLLKAAGRCNGFTLKTASGIYVRHLFSDDTVGMRYEVVLEDVKLPSCDFIAIDGFNVCAFNPASIIL